MLLLFVAKHASSWSWLFSFQSDSECKVEQIPKLCCCISTYLHKLRLWYCDTTPARSETGTLYLPVPSQIWFSPGFVFIKHLIRTRSNHTPSQTGAKNRASSQTDTGCEWHFHFRGTGRCLWDRSFVTEASHIGILMMSCNLFKKFNKSFQNEKGKAELIIRHLTAFSVSEGTHNLQSFFPVWPTFNQSRIIILFLWWDICAMLMLDESVYALALAALLGDGDGNGGNLNISGGPMMPFKV